MLDFNTELAELEIEAGPYLVKIASNHREVGQAIQLRSRVFREDFGASCDTEDPYWDWSELDDTASHLIAQSRETGEVVGTYRLIASCSDEGFYSQSEFDIAGLLACPGVKLELSRACIEPGSRTGPVMTLLWKGLVEAVRRSEARYLFGCSSLLTEDPAQVRLVMDALAAEGSVCADYGIGVLPEFELASAARGPVSELPELPSLLRLYLKVGAKVAPTPAHDRAFRCVDLLTVLEVAAMNPILARRYGLNP